MFIFGDEILDTTEPDAPAAIVTKVEEDNLYVLLEDMTTGLWPAVDCTRTGRNFGSLLGALLEAMRDNS